MIHRDKEEMHIKDWGGGRHQYIIDHKIVIFKLKKLYSTDIQIWEGNVFPTRTQTDHSNC